ncbi:endonuclease III [Candidatus Micrarchaeota archaeon]|nr:MAG: endonuclease III [Candidatus Micrarchaeota archaeon]
MIMTVLSQNTSDVNSHRAFSNLRKEFRSWNSVANAPKAKIASAIRIGGLANVKAKRIRDLLRQILKIRGNLNLAFLASMNLREAEAWLRSLPGVGPKTAAIVLCFCFNKPAMPVDTHIFRVSKRLGLLDEKTGYEAAHEKMESIIPAEDIFSLHVNLISLGRRICKPRKPKCGECPLNSLCPSAFKIN